MATALYQNAPAAMPADLFSRAVLLKLSFSRFGNTRQAPLSKVEVAADKARLRLSKKLLISPELDAVESFDNKLREWVEGRSLPLSGFSGVKVLALEAIEPVNERLVKAENEERPELIEKFVLAYPAQAEQARADLGPLWNPLDYPRVAKLRTCSASFTAISRWPRPGRSATSPCGCSPRERKRRATLGRYDVRRASPFTQHLSGTGNTPPNA